MASNVAGVCGVLTSALLAYPGACAHRVGGSLTFQQELELLQQNFRWDKGAWGALRTWWPWGSWQAKLEGKVGDGNIGGEGMGMGDPLPGPAREGQAGERPCNVDSS